MKNNTLVSVVLPLYNREKLVSRAIDSVLNQTYKNIELIICDDGSTDDSLNIAKQYTIKYDHIYIVSHKNMGIAGNKNDGIKRSSGEWIALLDSDDEYKPNHIQKRINMILSNPKIEFLYGTMDIIGDKFVPDKDDVSRMISILDDTSQGSTSFVKRSVYDRVGYYRDMYGEDGDFWERAQDMGIVVEKCLDDTYIYYRDTGGITSVINDLT